MRYLITFACYGGRLHGDESGSVDRYHNLVGSRLVQPDPERVLEERRRMLQEAYVLDEQSRAVVVAALRNHCAHRGWHLMAAHVRSNHVHAVVEAEGRPERILNEFKAYASRELNRLGRDGPDRRRWARHGSTRWLWKDEDVRNAIQYVVQEQGEPMALFIAEGPGL
ncbi:MAG TPA: transposase [Candidatus Angelobacter sp.]